MRKVGGLLLAAALMLPVAMISASPAGAAGGVSCATAAGTATFKPALPPIGSTAKVKGTLSAAGTLSKCTGAPGVTSAKTKFTSPKSTTGANCTTLSSPDPKSKGTVGTIVITWNNKKTSTAKVFTIKQVSKKDPVHATTKGKITAGLFVGKSITGTVLYSLPKGACSAGHPLAKVTYKGTKPFVIK
jgi:hypothetical protein